MLAQSCRSFTALEKAKSDPERTFGGFLLKSAMRTKQPLLGCIDTFKLGLMNCVKSFSFTQRGAIHPKRRLNIVARDSGGFGIVEQYYYRTEDEDGTILAEGWGSLGSFGIFADADLAEQEVKALLRSKGGDR